MEWLLNFCFVIYSKLFNISAALVEPLQYNVVKNNQKIDIRTFAQNGT